MARKDTFYIYLLTNRHRTVLYTGVTNSLERRIAQHRAGTLPGFTARYNVNRLVYHEAFRQVKDAIAREKEIKGWRREKKEQLIAVMNPEWSDLGVTVLGLAPAPNKRWKDHPTADSAGSTPTPPDSASS